MDVYPISVPQIDWKIYIQTFQDAFGYSPASGIDSMGLKKEIPASFIATLDFEKDTSPMDVLRNADLNMMLYHSFFSVVYIGDIDVLTCNAMEPLYLRSKQIKRDEYYAIISGSIRDWRYAVISGCNTDKYVSEFFTRVYTYLVQIGFREIWNDYNIKYRVDGTIIME